MKIAIHWFRCDLRLSDNVALYAACHDADVVVPIFIFDPKILKSPDTGAPIVGFMLECLKALDRDVSEAGGKLIFRHGDVVEEMRSLLQQTGAQSLYFNRDYEPQARQRDAAVEKLARSLNVEVHSFKDGVFHEPGEILKADGNPYRVFTAYRRVWNKLPKGAVLPRVKFKRIDSFKHPKGIALPTAKKLGFDVEIKLPEGGEEAAKARLNAFGEKELLYYATVRDLPAQGGTSQLSPYIRMGTLSPRTIHAEVIEIGQAHPSSQKHVDTFISELTWRDFYRQILWHFPHVATSAFKEKYDNLKWENNERHFKAWCEGRTGFPVVDAGMRQLNTIGWMHNRVRMIVAAFLTKDLLISYQWGERYFMQKLLDADLAQNNGGWQWSASTGTDAQPYFRIFNPMSQAKKFDPGGKYIHQYVPEIDTRDYPAPIVDHGQQRVKALALFRRT